MCGAQPAIESAKVELAVSAPLRSVQAEVPRPRGSPLRFGRSEPVRGRKFEQLQEQKYSLTHV